MISLSPQLGTAVRRWVAALLVPLAVWVAAGAACRGVMAAEDSPAHAKGSIAVELNKAEPFEDGCRLSFVIRNQTAQAFTALQWDLVFFDREGLIAGRAAAEAAPLPEGKTSMKQFDVPELACERLSRVLLNDVLRCETPSGDQAPSDCLRLIEPSSRTPIQFFM